MLAVQAAALLASGAAGIPRLLTRPCGPQRAPLRLQTALFLNMRQGPGCSSLHHPRDPRASPAIAKGEHPARHNPTARALSGSDGRIVLNAGS